MNKKGISAVVTTVLIILLSIIAVIILWAALRPTITNTANKAGTAMACTEVSLSVDSCVVSANFVNVSITRQGGVGNVTLTAAVSDADSSNSANMADVGPLDTRLIQVDKTGLTGTLNVQVAARLSDGTLCTPVQNACGTA